MKQPFFAKFDPDATWFDQLQPLSPADAPMFPENWPSETATVPDTVAELPVLVN